MTRLALVACLAVLINCSPLKAQKGSGKLALESCYLTSPLEGFHRVTLFAKLGKTSGSGRIELNPNACSLSLFGDPEICTKIAPTSQSVSFHLTKIADPKGLGRSLWGISGAPLDHSLTLISPRNRKGHYRIVYTKRDGSRRVIPMTPLFDKPTGKAPPKTLAQPPSQHCTALARKVDGVKAEAQVRPGFVNKTYFLFLTGRKPNLNTRVVATPVVYVKQPDYWRIDISECRPGDITIPTTSPYKFKPMEITSFIGKKGVEIVWANGQSEKIDVP